MSGTEISTLRLLFGRHAFYNFSQFLMVLIFKLFINLFFSECQNYQSLNGADRKVTYGSVNVKCDRNLGPGWFRFQGSAGSRMATTCPPKNRCDTHSTGWLNGGHPSVADGQVTRRVCFHWSRNCCNTSNNIRVRNCGVYYVYYLGPLGGWCHRRYCGSD